MSDPTDDLALIERVLLEFSQHAIDRTAGNHGEYRRREDALAALARLAARLALCPDCGIPEYWCQRVTGNPARCWRWDYERFDQVATKLETTMAALGESRYDPGCDCCCAVLRIVQDSQALQPDSEEQAAAGGETG